MHRRLLIILVLFLASCSKPETAQKTETAPAQDFNKLTDDLIYGSLALSPVSATQTGYHEHNGVQLDEMIDDFSPAGIDAQRKFYQDFQTRVNGWNAGSIDKEQQADLEIIKNDLNLYLLDLNTIQSYKHNPTVYVELAGNAIFVPSMLDYAPLDKRYGHIIKRLEKFPALFEQAKANLVDAPEVWNRVAREENQGNIDLVDKELRSKVPDAQKADYDRAATAAIAALKDFSSYLEKDLSKKTSDWRLGKEKYAQKFQYTLVTGKAPEQLLAEAEADLKTAREEMEKLAAPKSVKEALDDVAKQHATPDTYMDEAKKDLKQATEFVKMKDLLTLPPRSNLEVIPTPEFMRGIYAVGGFNPAPPLQPELGAFYWITPIPKTWAKDRIDSKLREYNSYGLQHLTVHEAMPGHYVQLEYANDVQPKSRRLLRNVFGNGPYVEGWAVYTQQLLTDEGYPDNSKGMRLTWYKQLLRVLANTILDVRLQTMGMTDQEALDLMINQTYQEKEEATAKLQRAQLSSCQLPTYYSGWKGWIQAREDYKAKQGSHFSLKDFHERALKESAVPMPVLDKLLTQ
ncbi:MAG TPA: DUF885 domain-containing protein [Terriglobia bacterium]|nr:DUF885 domain-containing protein [Terriglobia bacterium]